MLLEHHLGLVTGVATATQSIGDIVGTAATFSGNVDVITISLDPSLMEEDILNGVDIRLRHRHDDVLFFVKFLSNLVISLRQIVGIYIEYYIYGG